MERQLDKVRRIHSLNVPKQDGGMTEKAGVENEQHGRYPGGRRGKRNERNG